MIIQKPLMPCTHLALTPYIRTPDNFLNFFTHASYANL
jgi:hypothetical protein